MLAVVATDLDGRIREFVNDYDQLRITPTINGYTSVELKGVDPLSSVAKELLVAERALKVYDLDTQALRFFGKVWEPLERSPVGIDVVARDPLAEFAWRRVRDAATATYAATDFGDMLISRVVVQNALRSTYLRATTGNRQLSTAASRSWLVGKREDEIFDDVSSADGAPFYRVQPVDGVPGVMGDLLILYPNAGATREGVRFAYGAGTLDNCVDYKIVYGLPLNRFTASTSDPDGGRLAQPFQDVDSITRYGLFEDETTYSDATDSTLLSQQAKSQVRADPAYTIQLTPGLDAPKLFTDFNVGDFIRVRIRYGLDDLFTWARVVTATLTVDRNGAQLLESLTVDVLSGSADVTTPPDQWYRARMDDERRRLEALERRVQLITTPSPIASSPAPPGAGGGSTDPSSDPPPEPSPPPAPPPPAPSQPPDVSNVNAYATSSHGITVEFDADSHGVYTEAGVWLEQGGVLRALAGTTVVGAGAGHFSVSFDSLNRNQSYTAHVRVSSAAGANEATAAATTFAIDPV